jgi:hypothetical protein
MTDQFKKDRDVAAQAFVFNKTGSLSINRAKENFSKGADWGYEYAKEEIEQLLAEARTKAFNEAADSVEMIVGESDGHGISTKEVWDRAQSIRNKK